MKLVDIPAILQTGLAGLAFLLALLSYNLLSREQRSAKARPELLRAARTFFVLCIALAVIVGALHIGERFFRPVDAEIATQCARSLDNLRVESRNAKTLEQLRASVLEQDQSCRRLLDAVGKL
jgi:hypothetical protein